MYRDGFVRVESIIYNYNLHLACQSLSEGWFLLESLTVAHLCGVVYPLFGPGMMRYIHYV